jgi:hypothetical protein
VVVTLATSSVVTWIVAQPIIERRSEQQAAETRQAAVPEATQPTDTSGTHSSLPDIPLGSQPPNRGLSDERITASAPPPADSLPRDLNLAVPFTAQAPTANWDAEHEEFCEEASALMVGRFFAGRSIDGPDDAEAGLQDLKRWQIDQLGFFESTTAEETAAMIRAVYGVVVQVTELTEETEVPLRIKQALTEGKLVVVPAAGQKLGNPYFKTPGPVYHMLVIKGYTASGDAITNDPGTKRGQDYVYEWPKLFDAIGDWNDGSPTTGQKLILIVSKS